MANIAFTGRLSKDVEMRFSGNGKAIATLNVAENNSRKNPQTGNYDTTGVTWRKVIVFGRRAEHLSNIKKGTVVLVQGREETREYTTKDGQKGSSLEVIADIVGVVPTGSAQNAPQQPNSQQQGSWGNQSQQDAWGGSQGSAWGSTEEAPF